jgi:hypothetical protein
VTNPPRNFTRSVVTRVQQELGALGFRSRKGILTLNVQVGVIGTVGLNKARGHGLGVLEVNPVVGIRNQNIERLVAELCEDAFDEVIPPTLAGNIGYLSPANHYLPFLFRQDGDIGGTARELCEAVKLFGLPFINECSDLLALVHAMQTARFGIPSVTDYRLPVGLWLLGEHIKAKAFLAARVEDIGARKDPAAIRYMRFAERLAERLAT